LSPGSGENGGMTGAERVNGIRRRRMLQGRLALVGRKLERCCRRMLASVAEKIILEGGDELERWRWCVLAASGAMVVAHVGRKLGIW
jgi:hypothetical protein